MASIRDKLASKTSKLSIPKRIIDEHPASTKSSHTEGSFYQVDITLIKPNPDQPRQHFDENSLEELSNSIKQSGIIQPIIIRKDENNTIFLVAGERRLRASKKAGLTNIPCILTKGNPAEIALIENLQRENLNPIDESEAFNKMIKNYNYSQQDLSKVIGKARSTIAESVGLMRLPDEIKNECRRADFLSRRTLVEISKQKTNEDMVKLFNTIKQGNLKSDDVRKITRKKKSKDNQDTEKRKKIDILLLKISGLKKVLEKNQTSNLNNEESKILLPAIIDLKKIIDKIVSDLSTNKDNN